MASVKGKKQLKEALFLIPEKLTRPFFAQLYQECERAIDTEFGDELRPVLRFVLRRDEESFDPNIGLERLRREFEWSKAIHVLVVVPTSSTELTRGIARSVTNLDDEQGRSLPVVALALA